MTAIKSEYRNYQDTKNRTYINQLLDNFSEDNISKNKAILEKAKFRIICNLIDVYPKELSKALMLYCSECNNV